jgi:hypothetical protein
LTCDNRFAKDLIAADRKDTFSDDCPTTGGHGTAVFDDENVVSCAGLVGPGPGAGVGRTSGPVGPAGRVVFGSERIRSGAANPTPKLTSIIAGMLAGADSIDDLDVRGREAQRLFAQPEGVLDVEAPRERLPWPLDIHWCGLGFRRPQPQRLGCRSPGR